MRGGFGGLLALRAAAFDQRFAACIFHGGIFDMYDSFLELFPPDLRPQLSEGNDAVVNQIVGGVMSANPGAKAMIGHGMYVMGVASPGELVSQSKQFTLNDVAHQVSCPTLIIDGTKNHFLPNHGNHGKRLYDALTKVRPTVYMVLMPSIYLKLVGTGLTPGVTKPESMLNLCHPRNS